MTTKTTTCPDWCSGHHPALEPETHQSETWRGPGLSVSIGSGTADGQGTMIFADHGASEYLSLRVEQAHELGVALIRAAYRARHEAAS